MRISLVLVVLVVGGCMQVFDLEGYTPTAGETHLDQPFAERVIGTTRAGTIVAATRDAFGFPDAAVELRLYVRGERFAQAVLEVSDWNRAISYDASTNTYRFDLVGEHCVVDDAGARCVQEDSASRP